MFDPFLFWVIKNYGQQNIPLYGDISFSFDQLVDLRNLFANHGSETFLCQSSAREFLLNHFPWMVMFYDNHDETIKY
jgi:hypothetical protein